VLCVFNIISGDIMLTKIAEIANELDNMGYTEEADMLTEVLERLAESNKPLNKPIRTPGGPKKFTVYVNDNGKTKKVNFGDPNMEIKRDDPARRKNYRARHHCDNPGPKTKANYWSCRMWEKGKSVTDMTDGK